MCSIWLSMVFSFAGGFEPHDSTTLGLIAPFVGCPLREPPTGVGDPPGTAPATLRSLSRIADVRSAPLRGPGRGGSNRRGPRPALVPRAPPGEGRVESLEPAAAPGLLGETVGRTATAGGCTAGSSGALRWPLRGSPIHAGEPDQGLRAKRGAPRSPRAGPRSPRDRPSRNQVTVVKPTRPGGAPDHEPVCETVLPPQRSGPLQ